MTSSQEEEEWKNKRESPRKPFVLKVEFPDRKSCLGATENMSNGGVFVQTDAQLEVGEKVPLLLSFPGLLEPVRIMGRVAWRRHANSSHGAGVGLSVDDSNDRLHLGDLISEGETVLRLKIPPLADKQYRVLIVEDNPVLIEMCAYILKKLSAKALKGQPPIEAIFSPDGHHALQQLQKRAVSLVMTDIRMPVMDGFELIKRIRENDATKKVPVVAISADVHSKDKSLELGADIFLRKPIRFSEVLETVRQLLKISNKEN